MDQPAKPKKSIVDEELEALEAKKQNPAARIFMIQAAILAALLIAAYFLIRYFVTNAGFTFLFVGFMLVAIFAGVNVIFHDRWLGRKRGTYTILRNNDDDE